MACLQGFNSTVFCYGPSGSGKSFTCYGPAGAAGPGSHAAAARWGGSAEAGIIPRAAQQLFGAIEKGGVLQHGRFLLRVSFVQLYRESLSDLLAPDGGNLSIREDPHKGVFVEGVTEVAVRAPQDVWALAARGQRARTTAATRINDVSSRSHALFTVVLEQVMTPGGGTPPRDAPTHHHHNVNTPPRDAAAAATAAAAAAATEHMAAAARAGEDGSALKLSRLNLVDLAGSERAALLGESGDRLEESKRINLSLSALAKVMSTLVEAKGRAVHVPYRDSKLTRMLQDSLGGNCRTTMIACVCPGGTAVDETLTTLQFAARAKAIRNHARVNLTANGEAVQNSLLAQYEAQLLELKEQLAAAESARAVEPAVTPVQQAKLEHERSAAEAALAQCVREYAKERAQKARLQQQITALQKRLLQSQIVELEDKVLIGGKPIAPGVTSGAVSAAAADDASELTEARASLAQERRRCEALELQVRDLTAKVSELTRELELCRLALQRWQARGTVSPVPGASPNTNAGTPLRELPQGAQGQGEVRRELAKRELELSNEREAREKEREHARKLQLQLDAAVAKAREQQSATAVAAAAASEAAKADGEELGAARRERDAARARTADAEAAVATWKQERDAAVGAAAAARERSAAEAGQASKQLAALTLKLGLVTQATAATEAAAAAAATEAVTGLVVGGSGQARAMARRRRALPIASAAGSR